MSRDQQSQPMQKEQTPSGMLRTVRRSIESMQRLDESLYTARRTLERRGIQFPPEIGDLVKEIRLSLMHFQNESEVTIKKLDMLQQLVQACAAITSSLEVDRVLDLVMDSVIDLTGAERAYLMLIEEPDGELRIRKAVNWDYQALREEEINFSRSVVYAALEKGEPIVTTNAQDDSRFQNAESIIAQGLRSILCIPLVLDGRAMGVMYTDNRVRQGLFTQEIVPLLAAFGTQASIAIEKARLHAEALQKQRLEEELNVAQKIQYSLLPRRVPEIPGWDFSAIYHPARVIGGDFFDFFEMGDGRLALIVADVSDKGVAAALFMAMSRTMIRSTSLADCCPSDALMRTNDLIIRESESSMFVTAWYGALDPQTGNVCFANGGHNRPLVWRARQGGFEELFAPGIILGAFSGIRLEDRYCDLEPGDILVAYTDGITEAINEAQEEFGVDRLRQVIAEHSSMSAQEIIDAISAAVFMFGGEEPQTDDITAICIKRLH